MTTENNNNEPQELPDEWLIKPCSIYEEEYSDCRSIRARFHQYFVNGTSTDCTQWKRDVDNCYKWEENKNVKAAEELIKSEKARRLERLRGHYNNNTWEKRKNPPEDWNKPLPEYLQKEYENTYLNIKRKEMSGEIEPVIDSTCAIM